MRIWMCIALLGLAPAAAAQPGKLSEMEANRIVATIQTALSTLDDIHEDDYPSFVQAADLDANGVDEIVYVHSMYCNGANFDCPDTVRVLSQAPPTKPAGRPLNSDETRALRSGYARDAAAEIPGEVMQLSLEGNRLDVTFVVYGESSLCKRNLREKSGKDRCPPPGRYRWAFAWTPGTLTRLPDRIPGPREPQAHFPDQIRDKWVTAGVPCATVLSGDTAQFIDIGWNRMTGKGEDWGADTLTRVSQVPWTWRIVLSSPTLPERLVPAVLSLSENNNRLIVIEATRVRTFDRCSWNLLNDLKRAADARAAVSKD